MTKPFSIKLLRNILIEHQYEKVRWPNDRRPVIIDAMTAQICLKVFDTMSDKAKQKIEEELKTRDGFIKFYNMARRCVS